MVAGDWLGNTVVILFAIAICLVFGIMILEGVVLEVTRVRRWWRLRKR